jgi:hypothetical protein
MQGRCSLNALVVMRGALATMCGDWPAERRPPEIRTHCPGKGASFHGDAAASGQVFIIEVSASELSSAAQTAMG